jgi:tripartite ATP-independent transporter DctM subunit
MITSAAFIAIMLVGVPIGLCLCLAGFVYIIASGNPVLFQSYPLQLFGGVDSYGLIAIPLFILIGEIMNGGGITRRIVDMAMAFVGSLKGGLAYVNILANMFISSILGSATAQVAIMAQIMVPEMEKKGYDKTFAAGLTAYGGMLGPIIPPSVMFVVYSVLAQVSVSDMLIAGIVPGVILTAMFCVVIALMGYVYNYPKADYQTPRQRLATILRTSPTLLIPIVIVGSILGGLANATESAAVGAVAAALVGKYWTREFEFSQLPQMMLRAGIYSAIVLFLVAAAAVFSWVLIFGKVPQETAGWIQSVAKDPVSFMLICNAILLLIGTVIDGIPGLIMTVPILLPVATDIYHIDPRHFRRGRGDQPGARIAVTPGRSLLLRRGRRHRRQARQDVHGDAAVLRHQLRPAGAALALSVALPRPHQSRTRQPLQEPCHVPFASPLPCRQRGRAAVCAVAGAGPGQGVSPRPDHANGHSWNKAALKLGDDLKAATNGRLTMTVFHSGQLGNEPAMMQQLQSGALDMGFIQAAELGSRVPHIAAINAPYIVRSTPSVAKFVRHPAAIKLFEVLPQETGTIGLGWGITGMRAIFSAKDLTGPRRHQGHEAAHQPDAGLSRFLFVAGRRADADPDTAGVRRHGERPGRRPRGGSGVLLEPALRQGCESHPADERRLHADGGGRLRPRLAVVAGRPTAS